MASDVFPEPDTPTTATVRHSGTSTSTSFRLLCRAPCTPMTVGRVPGTEISPAAISGKPKAIAAGAGTRPAPGALPSGMDWSAGPAVQAQRTDDGERRGFGELLDIRGGQHAGVLGDDGRGGAFGDGLEVAFDPRPEVLPARHVVGHRVDRGQRFVGAGFDVGDVGLVHRDVVAGGEPAHVPADEVGPRV